MSHLLPDDVCDIRRLPSSAVEHHVASWTGLRTHVVTATQRQPYAFHFKPEQHVLIAAEQSEREDGETTIDGLLNSNLRSMSGKLTFVPAGHSLSGWQRPRMLTRVTKFFIDPNGPLLDPELRFNEIKFRPRLFFIDPVLWRIANRLKEEALKGEARLQQYGEALVVLLGHELIRLNNSATAAAQSARGGLSGWQQRKIADYIEAHLSENVSLAALAALIDLSPFHFARAFKQSFGVPPHRYHVNRRIEHAKALLARPGSSVTEVALAVGFAETSSFSAAFRKTTGSAPSDYRRGLG